MTTPTRLAGFATALAAVFALAFGVGTWTAPDEERTPSGPIPSHTSPSDPTDQGETDDHHAH